MLEYHDALRERERTLENIITTGQATDSTNCAESSSFSDSLTNPYLKVIFIDDRVKNLVPAIAQGIPSYHFTTPVKLEADLKAMGADLFDHELDSQSSDSDSDSSVDEEKSYEN